TRSDRDWSSDVCSSDLSLDFRWETFGEYLAALRAVRPSINVAHFVGHGALRLAAVGSENHAVSPDNLKAMQRRLDEAMDAGAYRSEEHTSELQSRSDLV